jgi:laccase
MGMAAVFIVEDGPTADTSLPPPPADFPTCCANDHNSLADELSLKLRKVKSDAYMDRRLKENTP